MATKERLLLGEGKRRQSTLPLVATHATGIGVGSGGRRRNGRDAGCRSSTTSRSRSGGARSAAQKTWQQATHQDRCPSSDELRLADGRLSRATNPKS